MTYGELQWWLDRMTEVQREIARGRRHQEREERARQRAMRGRRR